MAAHLGERGAKGADGDSSIADVEDLGLSDAGEAEGEDNAPLGSADGDQSDQDDPAAACIQAAHPNGDAEHVPRADSSLVSDAKPSADVEVGAIETEGETGEGEGTTTAESGDEVEGANTDSGDEQAGTQADGPEGDAVGSSGQASGALEAFMDTAADPYSRQYQRCVLACASYASHASDDS